MTLLGRGQSGKSTTAAALGDALQRLTGWSTVLVDLDATALLSKHLVPLLPATGTTEDALSGHPMLHAEALRPGLAILPAGPRLAQAEVGLDDAAVAERLLQSLFRDDTVQVAILDTQAMRPMVAGSAPLLRGAIDAADVVVIPFGLGAKNADHLELALADLADYQRAAKRTVPLLLLPTMAERDQMKALEVGTSLAGAVGRAFMGEGFRFLPPIKRAAVVQRSEYEHRLLASMPGEHEVVRQYQVAAEIVADVLAAVA